MSARHTVSVGGFRVRESSPKAIQRYLDQVIERRLQRHVFFANHNFVVQCRAIRSAISEDSRSVLLNDGVGMDLAAMLLRGSRFQENLNGTDLVPLFLRDIRRPIRVYLLGSSDTAVRQAARRFSRLPNVDVVGWCDGFSLWRNQQFLLDHVRRREPDVLLVAMGNPLQEGWMLEHGSRLGIPLIMGVGALFEWASGQKARSPLLLRRLRLEWLYRMALEPRRLFRRYTIDFLRFLLVVLRESQAPTSPSGALAGGGLRRLGRAQWPGSAE